MTTPAAPSGTAAPTQPVASASAPSAAPRFARFPRATLPEEIANRLLDLIRAQELRPGDKLPAERELAGAMGVSRPVLREALRALALMRVVDIRHGDGTYVTALEPRQLVAHLDVVFATDTSALGRLLEARRIVESGNARLAAGRIGRADLDRLAAIVDDLGSNLDDPIRFGELDIAFHDLVGAASDNFLLAQFMRVIGTMGRVSRRRTGGARSVREAAYRDHLAILAALQAGDPDAAEAAMRVHLDHVEAALEPGAVAAATAEVAR